MVLDPASGDICAVGVGGPDLRQQGILQFGPDGLIYGQTFGLAEGTSFVVIDPTC